MADILLTDILLPLVTPGIGPLQSSTTFFQPGANAIERADPDMISVRFTKPPWLETSKTTAELAFENFNRIMGELSKKHLGGEGILRTDFGLQKVHQLVWIVSETKAALFTLKSNKLTVQILKSDDHVRKYFKEYLQYRHTQLLQLLFYNFSNKQYSFKSTSDRERFCCDKGFFTPTRWALCKHEILNIGYPLLFESLVTYKNGSQLYGNFHWNMGFGYRFEVRINPTDSGFELVESIKFDEQLARQRP